ncbi:spore germination protein [Clostridium felsineum]|uniref:spore germination protein n=1 Tax=Clostridium felsineum TaxID=36839 RepID=UPI00214D3544|nr:spore germination protein [Clostridium felsineum]MCR3758771.1 spore germination protein [Clostridium felsineum]
MNKSNDVYLSGSQITFYIFASLIGVGFTYLPNAVIEKANQDGWIACIVGAVYPLFLIFCASYMCKKSPKENILVLSEKYFGGIIGNILNFIFLGFFLFVLTSEISGFNNVFTVYASDFLKKYQVIALTLVVTAYAAYKGIKPLGRLCEVTFYLTIILIVLPIETLKEGNILNIMPIGQAGLVNVLKASKDTAFFYTGAEAALLIYPFVKGSKKLLKSSLVALGLTMFIYTWVCFLNIYYYGIDASPKLLWPTIGLSDSIHIPIINSFRFIFISLWSIVIIRCISVYYFAVSFGISRITKKISAETVTIFIYPIVFLLSMLYGNTTKRRYYSGILTEYFVLFILIYVSIITIITKFKEVGKHAKE